MQRAVDVRGGPNGRLSFDVAYPPRGRDQWEDAGSASLHSAPKGQIVKEHTQPSQG